MSLNIYKTYQPVIRLTEEAINWLTHYATPVATKDFLGYIVAITKDISCIVGVDSTISPISSNPKKSAKLSKRKLKKCWKILINTHFVRDASNDPFPEYEPYNNIPFNINDAIIIEDYALSKNGEEYIPDDDVSDITNFMEITE